MSHATLSPNSNAPSPSPPFSDPFAEVKDAKFEEWSSAVENLEYSSETPMGEVTVPW